ncbi:hypothetical protein ACWEN6_36580 [Sphaerisporangium sp. NPDC004334]
MSVIAMVRRKFCDADMKKPPDDVLETEWPKTTSVHSPRCVWSAHKYRFGVDSLRVVPGDRSRRPPSSAFQTRLNTAVLAAREAGHSWAEIGAAVGITRQSAHERWARAARTEAAR